MAALFDAVFDATGSLAAMAPSLAYVAHGGRLVLADDGRQCFALLHKPYSIEELSRILRKAKTT